MAVCVCVCVCVVSPITPPPHTKVVMRKADRAKTDTFIFLKAVDAVAVQLPFKQLQLYTVSPEDADNWRMQSWASLGGSHHPMRLEKGRPW